MERYNIPKEISSQMKFTKSIYLFDLVTICISLCISWIISPLVYDPLRIPFYIFIFFNSLFLVNKSNKNPNKRNYQSIYYALKRTRETFVRH